MEDSDALRALTLAAFGFGSLLLVASGAAQLSSPTLDVDALRPGMRGYGLTVFRGTEPERFDVEIIDVLRGFRADQDLILVKTPHPLLNHARTVGGMSGSPIYVDGKLIGAYAYGWPFGLDPVAGVTPISAMARELLRPLRRDALPIESPLPLAPTPRRRPQAAAPTSAWPFERRSAYDALDAWATERHINRDSSVVRASTPLLLGGFDESIAGTLATRLAPLGLDVLQASAGGGPTTTTPTSYVPGGAIGVQLIRGDVTATAIGTVTHVEGSRVLAFGHPMFNNGTSGLPTATARVLHILASAQRSFKIAEAIAPLGMLTEDRQATIVSDTSLRARTIPLRIRILGLPPGPRSEWSMELASHRLLTPALTMAALGNALKAAISDDSHVTFTAKSRVDIQGIGVVEVTDIGSSPTGTSEPTSLEHLRLFSLLEVAYGNAFEPRDVRSIELELAVRFERDVTDIVDVAIAGTEVDPGANVPVRVRLRRYGQPEYEELVSIRIPEAAAGSTIEIGFDGGAAVTPEAPEPRNVRELVEIVRAAFPATSLVASLRLPSRGLRLAGHVLRGLPSSALDVLTPANDSRTASAFQTISRQVLDRGSVIRGSARVRVDVRAYPRPSSRP